MLDRVTAGAVVKGGEGGLLVTLRGRPVWGGGTCCSLTGQMQVRARMLGGGGSLGGVGLRERKRKRTLILIGGMRRWRLWCEARVVLDKVSGSLW